MDLLILKQLGLVPTFLLHLLLDTLARPQYLQQFVAPPHYTTRISEITLISKIKAINNRQVIYIPGKVCLQLKKKVFKVEHYLVKVLVFFSLLTIKTEIKHGIIKTTAKKFICKALS